MDLLCSKAFFARLKDQLEKAYVIIFPSKGRLNKNRNKQMSWNPHIHLRKSEEYWRMQWFH